MLNTICNYIVLAAAVITAIITILKALGKPIVFFRKQKEKERAKLTEDIAKIVSERVAADIQPKLDGIAQQNEVLIEGQRDTLRHFIVSLYRTHKKDRTLTATEKEMLDEFYADYKSINGNHYIDRIYQRMCLWTIVPDEE